MDMILDSLSRRKLTLISCFQSHIFIIFEGIK